MMLSTATVAFADHPTTSVQPTFIDGNPTCGPLIDNPDAIELKVQPVESGQYTDGTLVVDVTVHDGNLFDFTSNFAVLGVVAKGGPNANFYDYRPNGTTSDVDLHSPFNSNSGDYYGLSHISFCYLPLPGTELSLDSTDPDPAVVHEGDTIDFTVTETNDGFFTLTNVHLTVSHGGSCDPASIASLAPGASQSFDCSVTAGAADFTIEVLGHGTHDGEDVTWCSDPSDPPTGVFCDQDERVLIPVDVIHPGTTLSLNAGATDDLTIHEGDSVTIAIDETNTGDVTLTNVHITTDPALGECESITPASVASLAPGATASFECETGAITATKTITFIGHGTDPTGLDVTFCGEGVSGPDGLGKFCDENEIEEVTVTVINPGTTLSLGSVSPGTAVEVGSSVTITLEETNDGDVDLDNPSVTTDPVGICDSLTAPGDDGVLEIGETQQFVCTIDSLTADTSITFFGHGTDPTGLDVTWCEDQTAPPAGVFCDQGEIEVVQLTVFEVGEGCTPGFWKTHPNSWPAGINPGDTLETWFDVPDSLGLDNVTLLDALAFEGGKGVKGAAMILLRAAVASLLNAAHPDVDFNWTTGEVITAVNTALASGNRGTMLSLASELDEDNNAGCPL
ncbi:MAG TPA: hypothetical protein VGB52_12150 [Actinomycetota bacterium]